MKIIALDILYAISRRAVIEWCPKCCMRHLHILPEAEGHFRSSRFRMGRRTTRYASFSCDDEITWRCQIMPIYPQYWLLRQNYPFFVIYKNCLNLHFNCALQFKILNNVASNAVKKNLFCNVNSDSLETCRVKMLQTHRGGTWWGVSWEAPKGVDQPSRGSQHWISPSLCKEKL